jgi:prophage tail gpP-like protein
MSGSASAIQGGAASGAGSATTPDNTVTLTAGSQILTGWQSIRLTRGIDRVPSDFDITLTELYPTQAAAVVVNPGDPCTVKIGSDLVLTGYIDRYMPSFTPRSHEVRIIGRSKCQDLVDCSITPDVLNGGSMTTSSLLNLATKLAAPYGITVSSLTNTDVPVQAVGGGPLTFNAVLTETPYELIERIARWANVLLLDGTDGNLILANVGTAEMASGFSQAVNVEAASVSYAMDQRYKTYIPTLMSTNMYGQQGVGGIEYTTATDTGVTRFRELIVVSEQFAYSAAFAQLRIQREMTRRMGRSQAVKLTCDSWRDVNGALWAPNASAPIDLPLLKLTPAAQWIIGEVTYLRDADGTHSEIVMMPKEAFQPLPEVPTQFYWDPTNGPPPIGGAAASNTPQVGQ